MNLEHSPSQFPHQFDPVESDKKAASNKLKAARTLGAASDKLKVVKDDKVKAVKTDKIKAVKTDKIKAVKNDKSVKKSWADQLAFHYRAIATRTKLVGAQAYEEHITSELGVRTAAEFYRADKKYKLFADIAGESQPENILDAVLRSRSPFCWILNNNKLEGTTGYDVVIYTKDKERHTLYIVQAKVQKEDKPQQLSVDFDPDQARKVQDQMKEYQVHMAMALKSSGCKGPVDVKVVGCFLVYGQDDIWAIDIKAPESLNDAIDITLSADEKISSRRPSLLSRGLCTKRFICNAASLTPSKMLISEQDMEIIARSLATKKDHKESESPLDDVADESSSQEKKSKLQKKKERKVEEWQDRMDTKARQLQPNDDGDVKVKPVKQKKPLTSVSMNGSDKNSLRGKKGTPKVKDRSLVR